MSSKAKLYTLVLFMSSFKVKALKIPNKKTRKKEGYQRITYKKCFLFQIHVRKWHL